MRISDNVGSPWYGTSRDYPLETNTYIGSKVETYNSGTIQVNQVTETRLYAQESGTSNWLPVLCDSNGILLTSGVN